MKIRIDIIGSALRSAFLLVGFFSGCDCVPEKTVATYALIDGEAITITTISNAVMILARTAELGGHPIKDARFAAWGNRQAARIAPTIVQAKLLERKLRTEGIASTAASDEKILLKYNRRTRRTSRNLEELASLFGDLESQFRKQFAQESLFDAYFSNHPKLVISEKDLSFYYRTQTNLMKRCQMVNEIGWKKAREAYAKLKSGDPWDKVAQTYSEDGLVEPSNADNWKEWTTVVNGHIEPKELSDAILKLDVGGFTEPIDIDEGLIIVHLNDKDENVRDCARILIRMGQDVQILEHDDAVRILWLERCHALQRKMLTEIHKKTKLEYPLGEKFSYAIWPVPQSTKPQ